MADRDSLVYGLHPVEALLAHRVGSVTAAFVLRAPPRGRLSGIVARLEGAGIAVERVDRERLDRLAHGGAHQGVVLKARRPASGNIGDLERLVAERGNALCLLVLDQVEDPRNLGACLRTADAAAADAVIVPKARSAAISGAALKASAGAAEVMPLIVVPNLARVLRWLKDAGVRLVGADERSSTALFDADLSTPVALVLGAEGRGLRRLTREACDELVQIPMRGSVASLNVSVAAALLLYERVRQGRG